MQITRTALMTAMTRFAGVGGGVIVGRPGAGKSHALRQLAHELDRSGRRVLPISIDVLGISDLADLREALGIDGDLIKYLREQAPPVECRPAFLLFDAFDAVRSDVGQRQLVNLIRRVTQELAGIWTILVSVRTYDAERSAALLDLFPSGHTEPGFALPGIRCRHFWIPDLNDEERAEAVASITGLPAVYERASPAFRDLLRNPFNLWLMEKILLTQGEHGNLGQITSEVELLELFWKDRVDKGAKADVCQAIARKIARRMVETSSLSAPLGEAYEEQSDHAWRDLYSAEVLVKVGRTKQRVAFGHNMLFDYAVSTLLIDDTPEALAAFLREDSSRPLFLRPSLYYYFSSLWRSDLELFWETYWRIRFDEAVQTRLCATLLPPLIAAHQLLDPAQLDPLLRRRSAERDDTDRALKLLFQAIRFVRSESPRPDTTCDTAWLPVVALLAKDCSDELSYELGSWTDRVLKYAVTPGHEALLRACGAIARDLWRWIWNRRSAPDGTRFDGQASRLMLPLVTRTYGTDRAASRSLLTPVLDLLGTKDFPIDCVYRLCDDLPSIWPHDADFVGETYRRVFGYSEKSEAKTSMGTPVLPMSSTRRQDYQMCYYTLKEHFPEFLKAAPFVASRAALHVIEVYIRKEHIESHTTEGAKEQEPEVFAFLRGQAHYRQDFSRIWGQGQYHEDDLEIAAALFAYLRELSADASSAGRLDELLLIFRDSASMAYSWAQLLLAGSEHPATLGTKLFDLCVAPPIRGHSDTAYQLGECLKTTYPHFTAAQRADIERALLEVPPAEDAEDREFRERRRNRLVGCLPPGLIATPEAAELLSELKATDAVPDNTPPARFEVTSREFSTDDYLKDRGADPTKASNVQCRQLADQLGDFINTNRNRRPPPEDMAAFLPMLRNAWTVLREPGDAEPPAVRFLWDRVSESAAVAARGCERPDSEEYQLCRDILLRSATHDEPQPNPEVDAAYSSPHWSPAPRNEAARGLPWLAVWNKDERDAVTAVAALVADPVPSVRFLAVSEAWRLHRHFEADCWAILNQVASSEQNAVVQLSLCDAVARLVRKYEQESVAVLDRIQSAVREAAKGRLPDQFVDIVIWLSFHRDNAWANNVLNSFLATPRNNSRELSRATLEALEYLTPQNITDDELRPQLDRAKTWISKAIQASASDLRALFAEADAPEPEDRQTVGHNLYTVIDQVVTRTYFAAGLFKDSKHHPPVSLDLLNQFFVEVRPLLDQVLDVSDAAKGGMLVAPTAHHFMELLNGVLRCDPKAVLHMAHRVAKASQSGAYAFDSMAIREVVKLVESVLADHRVDVRDRESLDDLLGLLDIFVAAGWPEALNLVWRMDEIFR